MLRRFVTSSAIFILLLLQIAAYSLDYPASDRYDPSLYSVTVQSISSIDQLAATTGTHSTVPLKKTHMTFLNTQIAALINIYTKSNYTLQASGYLFKGMGDNDPWNRLVVIADGYDPGNQMHIDTIVSAPASRLVFSTTPTEANYSLIGQGYDLLFVDVANATADVRTVAKIYLRMLEEANQRSTGMSITAAGNSMGGVVARLALLYAQQMGNGSKPLSISKVKKLISIDGPQCGVSGLNISFQKFVKEEAADQYNLQLNTDAGRQLFYEHLEAGGPAEFNKFQQFMKSMGNYPIGVKKYAIANGNWTKPYTYTSAAYSVYINVDIDFYVPACPFICSPICYGKLKTFAALYKKVTFSGNDFEPGSSRDFVSEIDKKVYPILTTANVFAKMERTIFDLAGITSASVTGCLARIGKKSLSRTKPPADFQPTFIPITSVFDLNPSTPASLRNVNSLDILCRDKWTPFDKIYLTSLRNQHITFNAEYCTWILSALKDPYVPEILPIVNNVLNQ